MAAVNVVWGLSGLVRPVEQPAILGVPQKKFCQLPAPPSDRDVQGSVSFL